MIIYFKTKKLQKQCSESKSMSKEFGAFLSAKLKQRLMELQAANTLRDVSHLPPPRCHELVNQGGVFSVGLIYPMRLLFIPAHDPFPTLSDGGIDQSLVTEITILAIEDTHDKKNQRRSMQ